MIETVPYWCRIALLLLVMSLVAAIDWRRNRRKATKWKEYGFVVFSGTVGTLFGLLNDLITSSISPEYFIFGKGLDAGDGLTLRAGMLGIEAGFSAGAIAGAICLYAGTRNSRRPPLAYRRLLGFLWRPVPKPARTEEDFPIFYRFGWGGIDSPEFRAALTAAYRYAGVESLAKLYENCESRCAAEALSV